MNKNATAFAFYVGRSHGVTGKPITPSAVPGTAACVAAYVRGHNKGWHDAHPPLRDLIDDREDGAFH